MLGLMAIISFFLPALIGLINKNVANSDTRFWVSFAVCGIIGGFVNFIQHNGLGGYNGLTMLDIANSVADSILIMTGLVKLSYQAIWNSGDESLLQKLSLK